MTPTRAAAAVLLAGLCLLPSAGRGAEPVSKAAAKPAGVPQQTAITISLQTTRITAPLTPDGYPDYVEALNRMSSQGVTPENNAAVLLWKIVGPNAIEEPIRKAYFQRLGVPMPPAAGEYLIDPDDYAQKLNGVPLSTEQYNAYMEMADAATHRPWTKGEFPLLAKWLAAYDKQLSLAVEMSKRSKYFSPLAAKDAGRLIEAMSVAPLTVVRRVTRGLITRAMYRLGNHDVDGAWGDLMAVARIGRLITQDPCLVEGLVSVAVAASLGDPIAAAAHYGRPSRKQLFLYQAELAETEIRPAMAQKLDSGERFYLLDEICWVPRSGPETLLRDLNLPIHDDQFGVLKTALNVLIDWNVVLKSNNEIYDRIVSVSKITDTKKREAAVEKLNAETKAMAEASLDAFQALPLFALGGEAGRQEISKRLAAMIQSQWAASLSPLLKAESRATTAWQMQRIVLALAAYRSDRGEYPPTLAQLRGEYLPILPRDAFSASEFQYQRKAAGFRLYSFGPDGRDNLGHDYSGEPAGDDVTVQVPLPVVKK